MINDDNQKKYPDSLPYIGMIIEALRSLNGVAKAAAVKQWIEENMLANNLPVPDTMLNSGVPKFSNDIQWARMYLVNAEMLEPMAVAGYGNWKLTPKGWDVPLDSASIKTIFGATAQKNKVQDSEVQDAPPEDPQQAELAGMESWETVLKKILTTMPDKGFERLCAFIMTKNGLQATKVTGQSGDGGVDGEGMLAFDDLSLIKTPVAWQCKRFKENKVSSEAVRDFRGAVDGRAKYGLIFTTSSFTPSAEMEARRPGATPIELVGLERFIELMRKHAIGVQQGTNQISNYEVIPNFFDEYLHPRGGSATTFKLS
ncbi:MAG: restriction endonuclease [Pseudomonadota bacterium]